MSEHKIKLDTNGLFCGDKCKGSYIKGFCELYPQKNQIRVGLSQPSYNGEYYRCQACLDSEVKEPETEKKPKNTPDFGSREWGNFDPGFHRWNG